ncbi:MAG: DUF342 domain-containing protein [Spirochaetaceae bacterium]
MEGSTQSSDGYAEISIAEDGMSVLATLIPPRGEGKPIDVEYLETVLESRGIVHGVRWEELRERVLEVNGDRRLLHGVVLAQGDSPIDEVPAHLRIRGELLRRLESPQPPSDGEGPYPVTIPIVVVRRGETLARVVPKRKGQPGKDVFGKPVDPAKRDVEQVSPGKNTRITEGELIATRSGRLRYKDRSIWVDEKLEVTGSVDYSTGNIEFPGDVLLQGEIKDGFHVWAAGSVNAVGTVDVSQVFCKKSFVTPGGIIGRKGKLLRAGGQVSCHFVEHCQLESKSSIFIKEYAYQSDLYSLDRIVLGDEGSLIGGFAMGAHGVVAGKLGNEAEVPTEVVVGINFIGQRKLQSVRDAYLKVREELQRLERLREERETPALVRRMVHLTELGQQYATRMENLLERVDRNEEAEVIVRVAVYPGTHIRVCRAEHYVRERLGPGRFHLEKEAGRIVFLPLEKEE